MSQQVSQPATVARVCFVTPEISHLLSVRNCHLHSWRFLEYVKDWLPIGARAFHNDMGHPRLLSQSRNC
jgi:hypothetical protein